MYNSRYADYYVVFAKTCPEIFMERNIDHYGTVRIAKLHA